MIARWLARLRHDLVKQAAWRARDLAQAGLLATEADRAAMRRAVLELPDGEGRPSTAMAVWAAFRSELDEESPGHRFGPALLAFEAAVREAEQAARAAGAQEAGSLAGSLLRLEAAFEQLARSLKESATG